MNNVYLERSVAQMHREDIVREVSANRAARLLRAHRRGSNAVWRVPGFSSLGLGQTISERAVSS